MVRKHNISYLLILPFCFTINFLSAQQPTDCVNAITVCGDSEISLDVNGIGTQELFGLNNCSSQENNSLWLKVTLVTDGTLGFILTPESTSIVEDYDFFVFGPNRDCSNLGQAIRCSTTNPQAANQGNNLTGMNGGQSDTSEGPGPDGNSFVQWLAVSAGDTYYIVIDRPIGNSPFNLEWIGTAEFASPPTNQSSSELELNLRECDAVFPFDDFTTTFDLGANTDLIIGSQTNVTVTYFETETDANIDSNQIIGLYTNTANPQEVYAKITDDITGCFEIIPFRLLVGSGSNYPTPSNYTLCDDDADGDSANGQVVFDLLVKNAEILDGQNENDLIITYHESYSDAEFDINPLPDLYYNDVPFTQEIFVRIENAVNVNCFSIRSFNLIVSETPEAFNAEQIQCSDSNSAPFNLTSSNNELTGNQSDLNTLFFLNFNNALNGNNAIVNDTNFTNTSNPQTIYVQVKDPDTGCYSIGELTLRISNTSVNDSQILVCDDDGFEDGFHIFDLTEAETDIMVGLPSSATIVYYENLDDALLENNTITTNYTNTTPYSQTVYARVENDNNCYGIAEIDLIINELPDIETEDLHYYCLNNFPETITIDSNVADTLNYEFLWSTGEITETIEVNEPGVYTVDVADVTTGCIKTRAITVEPSNTANIESIQVNDASDNNTVTILTSGEGIYEYALFNEHGSYTPYQSNNVFHNVLGGIYTVHIRDTKNGCGYTFADVFVIGFPKFFTPNGDGENDTWNIKGATSLSQSNSRILIFDRYGKLLKELSPTGEGWDGTYNGQLLPVSDYWFEITLENGRSYKDHFTLKR